MSGLECPECGKPYVGFTDRKAIPLTERKANFYFCEDGHEWPSDLPLSRAPGRPRVNNPKAAENRAARRKKKREDKKLAGFARYECEFTKAEMDDFITPALIEFGGTKAEFLIYCACVYLGKPWAGKVNDK